MYQGQDACCPSLFLTAPGSGHGKTTVTAALARYHVTQGRRVQVFKAGPDFLDPMIHAQASGQPAWQLDLWLAGEAACRRMVWEAARNADLILVEGVMGLFDGEPSSADLASILGIPLLAVISAAGTAQTLGAIALGLVQYRTGLSFAGVLANNVATARHAEMIGQGMPAGVPFAGSMMRSAQWSLPERHLGLVQAGEVQGLEARLAAAATAVGNTSLARLPAPVRFSAPEDEIVHPLLKGLRIGIARDAAFSFLYPANLALLQRMGADLAFFSPLDDKALPDVDSIYLPGGYPELHLQALQDNSGMKAALKRHAAAGKPLYAECGGMLYLVESLTDKAGNRAEMAGVFKGHGVMQGRLQGLGYQTACLPAGELRCHTFHHSVITSPLVPVATGRRLFNTSPGEPIFMQGRVTASYLHAYFPSHPAATAALFLP